MVLATASRQVLTCFRSFLSYIRAISAAGIGYESHPRSSDQEALRLKHSEKSEIFVHCMLLLSTLLSTLSSLLV
jgi:hypothetical protein